MALLISTTIPKCLVFRSFVFIVCLTYGMVLEDIIEHIIEDIIEDITEHITFFFIGRMHLL